MNATTEAPPFLAFTEADSDLAHAAWGANCGPGALAACVGWTLDAIRPHLGDFERRGYMNPATMRAAIESSGHRWFRADPKGYLPAHGVVRVQWGGSWLRPGVPKGAAAARTHWIATKGHIGNFWAFDINGGWMRFDAWERDLVPLLTGATKGADGTFSFIDRWEVRKRS